MVIPALVLLLAYLVGSIPTGVLLGRIVGRDPRKGGSGNIGATNVTRTLGRSWGAVTLLVDVGKGWLPVFGAEALDQPLGVALGAGFAAVIGHCFPVWLKLRGGKGVATALGVMFAVAPIIGLLAVLAWLAVALLTRTPALGSLAASVVFVVAAQVARHPFEVQVLTVGLAALLWIRHTQNLRQLVRRNRPRPAPRQPRPRRKR